MLNRTNLFTSYLGRNAERERVFVTVETEPQQHPDTAQTTEHEPVPAGNLNLSVTYWTLRYRTNRGGSFGSGSGLTEQLSEMTEIAPGWTTADIRSLSRIAKRWHLNGMRGACAHMGPDAVTGTYNHETRQVEGATICPETGYRNGSAWLTEIVPAEVWTELRRLSDLPRGPIVHSID